MVDDLAMGGGWLIDGWWMAQKWASQQHDVVWMFLDQVSRADLKVGEETLFNDFGEFRHYLSEKAVYNKVNRGAGKEMVDVSPSVFRFGGVGDATTS